MKIRMLLVSVSLLVLCGCHDTRDYPLISVKKPAHPIKVQTENIQWNSVSENKQELNDEI